MTSGYYCAIFPFCGGGKKQKKQKNKKKDDKKTKVFYDWATTGIPVKKKTTKKQRHFMTGLHTLHTLYTLYFSFSYKII